LDRTRYDRLFAVFDRARELSGSERAAYLERACGDDSTLRHEVEELLGEDENESNPIGTAAADGRRAQLERILVDAKGLDAVGESLGPFRILRRIGAGGMGTVYEAEQDRPHRRVALKVLHPTHAFGDRLRRFRRESEILARLHHPGIAQVYAAETVDHGFGEQPWFAMELVDGLPLVDFAERRELARDERLELVALVCDAVQHAHDSGIVHRDLKPDNVLVDDEGRPKVLDFGVAHASDPGAQLSTIQTGQGEVLGTLTHMAPEQLAGDPDSIGTPADVWALGVIVFELLTGRLPYELAGLSLTAAIRLVTDREPMRLSKLDPRLRGDLDTIVARALETEPARRYPSPAALAADLRRFLESRPITARPASKSYRARKFVQRNPVLVAGASATVLAILVGSAASAFYARRAASERDLALEREAEVKAALYGSVRTALATDPWRARLDLERIGPDERDWVWCWLARQTPLLLEPLGPQPGRRFYSPLPLFADERTLIEMFPNKAGGYMPARIDLASPDRAEFLLEGAHAWGLSVADGEARMLDPDGWLGIDLRTGDVDRRAHDGYYSPWAGPDGLAVGQTGGEAEQRLVVSRSDRSGVV